jgi:hypothetical protein
LTFSDITTDIDSLCGSSSASYPLATKTRNVNAEYQRVAVLIDGVTDSWQFDDYNQSAPRTYTATMSHASANYLIPNTLFRVEGVEVKDDNGDWVKLRHFEPHNELDVSREEFMASASLPIYYNLEGNNVYLTPPPHSAYCTVANGLMVRASRTVTEFPTTATTTVPGFASPFHRILSLAAAIDFERNDKQRNLFLQMRDRLEKGLIRFYSSRDVAKPSGIYPRGKRLWRQYL